MFGKISAKTLCRVGAIAALYVVVSLLLFPFTFGLLQLRLSEAFTVLPLFFAESVPALFIGCFITNFFGAGVYDVIIGSAATLIAAIGTRIVGKHVKNKYLKFVLGIIFPVVFNAFAVPLVFLLTGSNSYSYFIEVLIVGAEELCSTAIFGGSLYFAIYRLFSNKKTGIFADDDNKIIK